MEISRIAAGVLATACVAAGAGGTFLALRGDSATSIAAAPISAEAEAANPLVAESEAVVEDEPAAPVPVTPAPSQPRAARPPSRPAARPAERPAPRPPESRQTAAAPAPRQDRGNVVPIEPPIIADNDASRAVELPGPVYEELVVAADSVIGLELESAVSSERAQIEDSVVATVTRDVRVADRVAIPAGARAFGEVTEVDRGGKVKGRARLGIRFTSIVLGDGTRLRVQTETIYREGDAQGRESAAKIGGGAIGGAIIGGILGGAKGAAIGGSIGAGAGTAAAVAGGRNHATLDAGTPLTVRLEDPVTVTVER